MGDPEKTRLHSRWRSADPVLHAQALADQAFSRAAGAPLVEGNRVRLLRDAAENYPAWLAAIAAARHYVHFENYIVHDDLVGRMFADALLAKVRDGVRVRILYDWLGGLGAAGRGYWNRLRDGGVEVRCYNPPRFDSPLGWLSRDHRKMIVVDGTVGFVTGLCVGQMWAGNPAKGIEPWRDTGVEVRGPAVTDIERAFARVWALQGDPLPEMEPRTEPESAGLDGVGMRIVASEPSIGGTFRLDQLVVAFARRRVWLTDAYYVGSTVYMQALITAARDGVDVRLLLPGTSDVPVVSSLSRSGYRPLLEAGVRIYEWNGLMLHAKTAVVDGRWARVGSTNLNLASWFGNCELEAVIEDERFAREMEAMYLEDLSRATEIILNEKSKVRAPGRPSPRRHPRQSSGSASRAATGVVRISNAIGAAMANRRRIESPESRLMVIAGLVLLVAAIIFGFYPQVLAYPTSILLVWFGFALVCRGWRAWRSRS